MITNDLLNLILKEFRINDVLLSEMTNIHTSTISRYRNNKRNIGKKSFEKIYDTLIELNVSIKTMKELRKEYENSRLEKVLG